MRDCILSFAKQFEFQPEIGNVVNLKPAKSWVVGGMGGSHLAAGLLKIYDPALPLRIHRDYGLPRAESRGLPLGVPADSLYIASSYSGNIEETIDFAKSALAKKLNLAVISKGGQLLQFARENNLPHIQLPEFSGPARLAVGYSITAMAKFIGEYRLSHQLSLLPAGLQSAVYEKEGESLATRLSGKIPVIYSSTRNKWLAYNWKVHLNETARVPAFFNVFPELNHNEIAGMDKRLVTENLLKNFHFIFLHDKDDDERIGKRMEITKKLYQERGLPVTSIELSGGPIFERLFNSIILAAWTAYYLAIDTKVDQSRPFIIEEFKKMIDTGGY